MRNPVATAVQTSISLEYEPTNDPPSLSASPEVELNFPDPDASWYGAWSQQADAGTSFTLSHEQGLTRLRLGTGKVSLAPVALPACAALTATSSVDGPWGTRLRLAMKATLIDGTGDIITTSLGDCEQPAMHPTFPSGQAGTSGAGGTSGGGGAPR